MSQIYNTVPLQPVPGAAPRVQAESLVDLLRVRTAHQPEQTVYTFLSESPTPELSLTYAALDLRARAIGGWLQDAGASGERVLLLFPPGLDYISAFFGCLYAGAVAVPAYPPRKNRNGNRTRALIHNARPALALTTRLLQPQIESVLNQTPGVTPLLCEAVDLIDNEWAEHWQEPEVVGETLAFLQYTSGSTANPKGVMVSHRNLLDNEKMIQEAFGQTEQSTIVGWLPLFHDMGLIGNVLQPLYVGAHCVLLSPLSFLQKPFSWLETISRYRATTSGGPNFAYEFCVRKISNAQRETLDLRSWTVAFNGSEPVRKDTIDRFCSAFEPCGFKRRAFFPCYGLAESTLFVAGGPRSRQPVIREFQRAALQRSAVLPVSSGGTDVRALVGCGKSWGAQIRIVDPDSRVSCPSGRVGEIWVSGDSIAHGYWGEPEESTRTFQAYLADTREGPYLRTGDLGFFDDGELFVTGRLKDLIIIRGRNCYPEDIELTVGECNPALRPGEGAAFSAEMNEEERLIIVFEVARTARRGNLTTVIESIRRVVAEEHDLQASAIILIKPGTMLKTSSGKIRRQAMKAAFLGGDLQIVFEWKLSEFPQERDNGAADPAIQTVDAIAEWIADRTATILGLPRSQISLSEPIIRHGLDSLAAIELAHVVETNLGVSLSVVAFMQDLSISEIADQVMAQRSQFPDAPRIAQSISNAQQSLPLSHGQAALWFLHQLAPNNAAYNVIGAARVRGHVDVENLRKAFQILINRHPQLRSKFSSSAGVPLQIIQDNVEVAFREEHLAGAGAEELNQRIAEEARSPFDLEEGPVFRITLLNGKVGGAVGERLLLIAAHHIVVDLWSMGILVKELGQIYAAEEAGAAANLVAPASSFEDYVREQQELLAGPAGERLLDYWTTELPGELPVLNLPTDWPRPAVQTYEGGSESIQLDRETANKLRGLARSNLTTLYTVLLAAYHLLLRRHAGQTELVVGSPTSSRTDRRFQSLVGYFVNPVPIRATIRDTQTFEEFLAQVRETVLAAFQHQEYPFAELVNNLCPIRDPSRSPVFQTTFVFEQVPPFIDPSLAAFVLGESGARLELGSLTLESIKIDQEISQFDLSMVVAPTEDGLRIALQYNKDLFKQSTIKRMLEHFEVLIAEIASGTQQPIRELAISTAREREMLREFNDTGRQYEVDVYAHSMFEAQAERTPEAIALTCEKGNLSYRELNSRANQLAHYLKRLGNGSEARVALLLNRGPEMIISMLAVLKAGGCYVPLDPAYPIERLGFMIDDAAASVLLTEAGLAARLSEHAADLVVLEKVSAAIAFESVENPRSSVQPDNLSHIIYTSGSTGRPKGVAISHSSLSNFLNWAQDNFSSSELAGVFAGTSLCFDLSVFEIFAPLSCGGTVILGVDALHLANCAEATSVTLLNTVPSAMTELLRLKAVGPSVETVNLAGEPLRLKLVQQIYRETSVKRVLNLYGPTEYTTYTTGYALDRNSGREPSIGRSIANTQVYVIDQGLRPAPIGVIGELYLGGRGLARGYWQRADLTAERFVPDHLSGTAGARLYRTGDLGRYLENGEIEYLGRQDFQVKVRGYRIELGEIESALLRYGAIKEAIVVARDDPQGEKQIVAYLVAEPDQTVSILDLRDYLKQSLPGYMIPQGFMSLAALPLTANGKVNRGALPVPDAGGLATVRKRVEPRTAIEEVLANIWAEVLGLEDIGVTENFFDLGGHSLKVVQVVSRLSDRLQVELPVRTLFEAPTVRELASVVEREMMLERTVLGSSIECASRHSRLPLSFAQQRLWFLERLQNSSSAYHISFRARFKGPLNLAALHQGINEIVRRHEALRTTFMESGDDPVQIIAPAQALPLPVVDLSHLSTAEREALGEQIIIERARRPFDLERGPLTRILVVRLSRNEWVLGMSMHHIVSDGWSLAVFTREIVTLYESFALGRQSELPELPIQYADFAVWQRQVFQGELFEESISYWRRQLAGMPGLLDLPTDRPRLPGPAGPSGRVALMLPEALHETLKGLSRSEGVTQSMLLLSCFYVLLARYAQQNDLCVGMPSANRPRFECEPLIGFFVNTLVLRANLSGDPSFSRLLRQVRELSLSAYMHQQLPFERLVEELQPERSMSFAPLVQVMFSFENAPQASLRLEGLSVAVSEVPTETAKFDLMLTARETMTGLQAVFEYNADLFEAATIEQMSRHFEGLLNRVAADPSQTLSQLSQLAPQEEGELLRWGQGHSEYPREKTIPQLFEEQVERTPDAIALMYDEEQLSYRELNRRANQLAHYLQARGVGPEVIVGILMERSVEVFVALLGTLKAGGAYLPLDPLSPASRLAFMLSDAEPAVLLTQQSLVGRLPAHVANVFCLDTEWAACANQPATNPNPIGSPDQMAYLMYTSGSTGVPKGVSVRQQGITRLVINSSYADLGETEVLLQYAPLSFDAATFEIWGSLLNGARLAVMKPGTATLKELGTAITRYGVTTMWLTASVFHLMVEEQLEDLQGVRQMLAGGDVLGASDVRRLLERYDANVVINGYGPTESTTFTCCRPVHNSSEVSASIPIGTPIGSTSVYVLDQLMQPVPVGVVGELYVGGEGLARGYWRRSDLTAERFLPDPYCASGDRGSREISGRLYRTGDRVKWLRAGELEFLGRIDQQVKVRGHRIELGEIEAVLGNYEATREAVVIARQNGGAGKRLLAYIVTREGTEPATDELREYVRARLPEYMVPAAFVVLPSLPLTINGKLDRNALPEPEDARGDIDYEVVAPRTELEEVLAGIWCEILQLREVGVYDNFFDLGGHSLLATQVISRIRQVLSLELPLRAMFESPDIATLSKRVAAAQRAEAGVMEVAPLAVVNRDGDLPLSFAQQRLWFLNRLEPGSAAYNISHNARIRGRLNVPALTQSINEIVRRHEVLRTTFAADQERPVQVIGKQLVLSPDVADLHALSESEREMQVRRLITAESHRPFDLGHGPLLRFALLQTRFDEWVLSLSIHHTVSDGWSSGVFIAELMKHYEAFCSGIPSPLPELQIQYGDFTLWQRQRLADDGVLSQLDYWKGQLSAPLAMLDLPGDRPRPAVRSEQGAALAFTLPLTLVERVRTLARREGATLFMALLAAFQLLLARYSGQTDVLVGTPVANRERTEIEPLIGNFVNTLVMRADLSGNPSFVELLARVRQVSLGAYAHQELPFERLVSEMHVERDLSRTPLFQVMMVLQNTPLIGLQLSGVSLQPEEIEIRTAKFDITALLTETADGISGTWEYTTDLFDATTSRRMVDHFQMLLEGIVENPQGTVFDIPLVSPSEQRQLAEFNETKVDYPATGYLHELFEAQAQRTPRSIGLIAEPGSFSYRELNSRANRLAHYLQRLGVGLESRVAIMLPRSPDLIISVLAVLKAGGAYVPLDPAYPIARLSLMIEDADASVLISEQALAERLTNHRAKVIDLNQEANLIGEESDENPATRVNPANLSHIIYTSGSTGKPKGVAIEHRSVVNFLHWAQQCFSAEELAGVLAATSICFDLSVFEIFAPLSFGGTVILADDALHLPALTAAQSVTLINTVPSAMAELLRMNAVGRGVLTVNLAGEALQNKLVQEIYQETSVGRVLNLYGPTEYTTYTTGVELQRGSESQPTIGRSLSNTKVHIVDDAGRRVPIGVAGEICIGGRGLARCYWNRPELTAERFIPDSLGEEAGGRLYLTGDLGRYLDCGEIEYLGRKDQQVKIRGYRIELGEIESVLAECPGVDAAAVIAREESGHKFLVGYVASDGDFATNDLRAYLQAKLPAYMVPANLVRLDQLPLTPNGKLDRQRLPSPVRETGTELYEAPGTYAEKTLAVIWEQVLKLEHVGLNDNFFDLGGDSILSIHVVASARRAGLVLTPRQFFQHQTLGKLAASAEALAPISARDSDAPAPPAKHSGSLKPADFPAVSLSQIEIDDLLLTTEAENIEDIYPLTSFQQGMLFHILNAPDAGIYLNQQRYTLRGSLDLPAFRKAFDLVMERHQIIRTAFLLSALNGPAQVVYRRLTLPWVEYDWQELSAERQVNKLDELLKADYDRGFELTRAPLMRVAVIRRESDLYEFIWSFHLLLMDGWSVPIIFRELLAFYRALRGAQPVELERPVRYGDYIAWLQKQDQLPPEKYWRDTLDGFVSPTSLAFDKTPAADTAEQQGYGERSLLLNEDTTALFRSFAIRHRLTINTLLQGAWASLLSRRSGKDDVVFGSVVSGRAAGFPGVDSAVGVFVNALPVRVRLPPDGALVPWLLDLQAQQAEARRFEFCSLVRIQGWSEVPRGVPLFNSVLIFQNIPTDLSLPESEGLNVIGIHSTERTNVPLALVVEPHSQMLLRIVYQRSRFNDSTIARILESLQRCLIEITTNSEATLATLNGYDPERTQLVNTFNQSWDAV